MSITILSVPLLAACRALHADLEAGEALDHRTQHVVRHRGHKPPPFRKGFLNVWWTRSGCRDAATGRHRMPFLALSAAVVGKGAAA